jgi:hypothetical protein
MPVTKKPRRPRGRSAAFTGTTSNYSRLHRTSQASVRHVHGAATIGDDFDSLCDLVVAGQKLPRLCDLLRGVPFFRDDINSDARSFAETILDRLVGADESADGLIRALAELTGASAAAGYITAAVEFDRVSKTPVGEITCSDVSAARCHFYAAVLGDAASLPKVAAHAVECAYSRALPTADVRLQCRGAVGWLLAAAGKLTPPERWTRPAAFEFVSGVDRDEGLGRQMLDRMLQSRTSLLADSSTIGSSPDGQQAPEIPVLKRQMDRRLPRRPDSKRATGRSEDFE